MELATIFGSLEISSPGRHRAWPGRLVNDKAVELMFVRLTVRRSLWALPSSRWGSSHSWSLASWNAGPGRPWTLLASPAAGGEPKSRRVVQLQANPYDPALQEECLLHEEGRLEYPLHGGKSIPLIQDQSLSVTELNMEVWLLAVDRSTAPKTK